MFGFIRRILEVPESEIGSLKHMLKHVCSHPIDFIQIIEADSGFKHRFCGACEQYIGALDEKEAIEEEIHRRQIDVEGIRKKREDLLAQMRELDRKETNLQLELEKLAKDLKEKENV